MSRMLDQKQKGKYPFKYVSAEETDVGKTFERIRRELAEQRDKHDETKHVVRQIKVGEGK